ncbi:2-hydroxymuconate tautomerase [compost metagenome]
MPIVRVELLPGRTQAQKASYVRELTRITAEILECPPESIDVIFTEIQPHDWAHAGQFYNPRVESSA